MSQFLCFLTYLHLVLFIYKYIFHFSASIFGSVLCICLFFNHIFAFNLKKQDDLFDHPTFSYDYSSPQSRHGAIHPLYIIFHFIFCHQWIMLFQHSINCLMVSGTFFHSMLLKAFFIGRAGSADSGTLASGHSIDSYIAMR